jgi:hypothetical protein
LTDLNYLFMQNVALYIFLNLYIQNKAVVFLTHSKITEAFILGNN